MTARIGLLMFLLGGFGMLSVVSRPPSPLDLLYFWALCFGAILYLLGKEKP